MSSLPNFDEARQSQLPFVELLINMGYTYITKPELEKQRRSNESNFLLTDIANSALMRINSYEQDGKKTKFSEREVADAVDELENIQLEGLIDTSKTVYNMIMPTTGGKTIKVFHGGKTESKSFRYIDFADITNNDFHVAVEYSASGKSTIRVDIICFVNGIPFALIENKKSSVETQEALNQLVRNQTPEKCPKLFIYPQLLVGTNGNDMRYGTTGTPTKFYTHWKERDTPLDEQNKQVQKLITKKIDTEIHKQLCYDLNGATKSHKQILERIPTEQDRSVLALFDKTRLLDLAKNFTLYDGGDKKVMRYPQYYAIKNILTRVDEREKTKQGQRRKGGVIWHTQGSGKSLTMVMFVKALIEDPNIKSPRIIIVTDRIDLDKQILGTFENANLKKKTIKATSGEHLLELIKSEDSRVITTLVHKFAAAGKNRANFEDLDENVFVLIDEGHRTQGGEANLEMNRVLPNACYIAFTGTPLLKEERSANKFGTFIDTYTIDDALADGVILPLIYEGRYVDLHQDKEEIDRQTERLTSDLTESQKKQVQNQVEKRILKDNKKGIEEIAYDIESHYIARFQGTGLKAQVVAPSKYSATLFKKYFDRTGKINTALIISDGNGILDEEDEHKTSVVEYLEKIKAKYVSLKQYEDDVTRSFVNNEDGIEILIVVDKLLTGFDAPRNTVLYLAKELHDHNLLQAIARVNRIFENPAMPKTSGFVIDYSENAENIDSAMDLFGNYDENDVKSALINVQDKINDLQQSYGDLHDLFNGVAKDVEAYEAHLSEESDRKIFYESLRTFISRFNECLSLQDFGQEFSQVDLYRNELKKFMNLRRAVSIRYTDSVDFSGYRMALVRILDDNIRAEEAEVLTKEIDITNRDERKQAIDEMASTKSKADAIVSQTRRTITERAESDPIFYEKFSHKIEEIIKKMRSDKLTDIEALKQLRLISDAVLDKKDDELPSSISKSPAAAVLYHNFEMELGELVGDEKTYEKIILELTKVIKDATIVDWQKSFEVKRQMRNKIDDFLYDEVKGKMGIDLDSDLIEMITEESILRASLNLEEFSK